MLAFLLYLNMLYQPVSTLGRLNEDLQNALAAADRVLEVLDTESEITDSPDAYDIGTVQGRIAFENVSFSYHDAAPVLKDISLTVEPGETLALVGRPASGKRRLSALWRAFTTRCRGGLRSTVMTCARLRRSRCATISVSCYRMFSCLTVRYMKILRTVSAARRASR